VIAMVNCTITTSRRRKSIDETDLTKFDVFVDLIMTQIIERVDANSSDLEFNTTTAPSEIFFKEELNFILQEALQEIAETVKNETGIDLDPVEVKILFPDFHLKN
jgi:hypothetical protein